MFKYLAALLKKILVTDNIVDVETELLAFRKTQDRLKLAVEQQMDKIAESESEKLELDVELQDEIKRLEAEHKTNIAVEDANIKASEEIIDEAEAWLDIFPKK